MKKFNSAVSRTRRSRSVVTSVFALSLTACGSQMLAPEAPGGSERDTSLACTLPTNCADSQPGSELIPLRFDGSAAQAMMALQATLTAFPEAKILRIEALSMEVVFTTPAGFQDLVDFRIDTPRQRIDYRSRSRFGLYDFGKNRSRMKAFAQRFEQSHIAFEPAKNKGGPLEQR